MESKTKLKSKKTSEILTNENENFTDIQVQSFLNEFIEVGAICGDGTFTENTGRGAGSHHNGVKYKLYAKKGEIFPNQKSLTSKTTAVSSTLSFKSQQGNTPKQSSLQVTQSSKKKSKKISLKDGFKTKTKKTAMFQKLHNIFDWIYKDELPIVEQQLNDDLWLIVASVCNLYDELQATTNMVKSLQASIPEEPKKKQSKSQKDLINQDAETLVLEIKTLKKDIQKLTKANSKLEEELEQHKLKEKNFKKMLKFIEKQNPKILQTALESSHIQAKDLKKQKKPQSRVTTRSMLKKQQSKAQDKKGESLFSSDQQPGYNEENTIVGLIKGMK